MSGMFWHNNYAPSVQIDSLLSEEDITLCKLMDAEDILQECKGQNKKLIEYLTRSDILEELVNLITEEPSEDLEERWRYKYSNVACELLTCDLPIFTEKLAANEMLLSKLYSFIDKDQPLNPLLASFFSKTLHALLRRASDQNWFSHEFVCLQVLESLKSRKNCVDLLLQHIQTSAIMDLILILITKIEGEMRQNILDWLHDQQLVPRLVKLLSPSSDPEKHTNVSQLLCDIIKFPRAELEKRRHPILQTLQSEETIKLILDTILTGEKLESSIVGGVRILINLLGQRESKSLESSETFGAPFNNIVEDEQRDKFALAIIPYLDKFNQLLLDPPEKPPVKTTAGFLEKPFGRTRLYILKLYVSLLSTKTMKNLNTSEIFEKFAELKTFNILLDLFFQYAWNNFLHTQVKQCLFLIINSYYPETNELIYSHIFVECKLVERILEAWENNDDNTSNQHNTIRQGYMGHLIMIANEIAERCEEYIVLSNFLKSHLSEETMIKWEKFTKTKLDEINTKQKMTLGDPPESYSLSSSCNSDEFRPYPDSYREELYPDYLEESPLPAYVDDYNFRTAMFNEGGDPFQNLMDPMNNQSFNITDDDYKKRQEIFNKICDERKFEDISGSNQWGQDSNFSMAKSSWLGKKKHNNSSSSDEEEEEEEEEDNRDLCMEAETVDPWNSEKPLSGLDVPWNIEAPQPVEETGWANFDNFNSAFSTDVSFQNNTCNEAKAELPEVPITINENTALPESGTGSNSNSSENKENVNETDDITLKTEKPSVTSVLNSDCIETDVNIPDGNANLAVVENRTSESNDNSKNSEDSPSNISEASSENLTNLQTVTSATDNVSPITTATPESSQ